MAKKEEAERYTKNLRNNNNNNNNRNNNNNNRKVGYLNTLFF